LSMLYFEICDLTGEKVAGAATIPFPNVPGVTDYRTVILSKLEPQEVIAVLKQAGAKT
jgi:hypothetical protein